MFSFVRQNVEKCFSLVVISWKMFGVSLLQMCVISGEAFPHLSV